MPGPPTAPLDDFRLSTERVILRSSDGIDLKVYKNILSLASPFFRKRFSSHPSESKDGEPPTIMAEDSTDVQVVELPESSTTLDFLLRHVYPIPPPSFPGLSESGEITDVEELMKILDPLLAAALKYDMQLVVEKLSTKLLEAAGVKDSNGRVVHDTLAVRIYTVACRYGMKDVARQAAHLSLKGRVLGVFSEDFRKMNAVQYYSLVNFHSKIVKAMESVITKEGVWPNRAIRCSSCARYFGHTTQVATWWINWYERATPIISESPATDEVFSDTFLSETYAKAKQCGSVDCSQVSVKLVQVSQEIKEKLLEKIKEHDIDLSVI